ncbi:MAG: hypothetical protein WDW38_004717 [Sanguina aurantia]
MTQRKYFGTDGIRGPLVIGRSARLAVISGRGRRAGADVSLLGDWVMYGQMWRGKRNRLALIARPRLALIARPARALRASRKSLAAEFVTVASEHLGKASRIDDEARGHAEHGPDIPGGGLHACQVQLHVSGHALPGLECLAERAVQRININRQVGSTCPQTLQQAVLANAADMGIAFDGDGDRLVLVDRQGAIADGDDILYVLARSLHAQGLLTAGAGSLSAAFCRATGGSASTRHACWQLRCALRRANVTWQLLQQHGGILGGETSGHILCLDRATTGDGIVAALAVLEVLVDSGQDLAMARAGLHKLPQVMLNVRALGARESLAGAAVQQALAEVEACARVSRQVLAAPRPRGATRPRVPTPRSPQLAERLAGEGSASKSSNWLSDWPTS